jgi:hypothetical protein
MWILQIRTAATIYWGVWSGGKVKQPQIPPLRCGMTNKRTSNSSDNDNGKSKDNSKDEQQQRQRLDWAG